MTIGERIHMLRKERHITMQQLADTIGVTKGVISKWESGTIRSITYKNLAALADALGTTTDEITGVTEQLNAIAEGSKAPLLSALVNPADPCAAENCSGAADVPDSVTADLALRSPEDLREAGILCGDLIYLDTRLAPQDGEPAVVLLEGALKLRQVFLSHDGSVLTLVGPQGTAPRVLVGAEQAEVTILGRITAVLRVY